LTALAVLNFIFGAIGIIGALLFLGAVSAAKASLEAEGASYSGQSVTMLYISALLMGLAAILLIVSAVGYLKQKGFGRSLGTTYALVSIASTILTAVTGGGIGVFGILFLVYPVLTLLLLNTSFKSAFARA
jgi:hypothetical protein